MILFLETKALIEIRAETQERGRRFKTVNSKSDNVRTKRELEKFTRTVWQWPSPLMEIRKKPGKSVTRSDISSCDVATALWRQYWVVKKWRGLSNIYQPYLSRWRASQLTQASRPYLPANSYPDCVRLIRIISDMSREYMEPVFTSAHLHLSGNSSQLNDSPLQTFTAQFYITNSNHSKICILLFYFNNNNKKKILASG